MKRYPVKNNTVVSSPVQVSKEAAGTEAFDIERLLANCGEILRREVANLMIESSSKKLAPASAKDLAQYIKLLQEMKQLVQESYANMTDEELAEFAKKLNNRQNGTGS